MDIPENFFGVGGEEDITIQTVTWPDVELPLPRNITEGEARGHEILTVKPIFGVSPTALEPEATDVGSTVFPEEENGTESATRPWGFPEESTPRLGPVTAFTSEDLVVQVTIGPGAAEVPGQPRLPGGKCHPWAMSWRQGRRGQPASFLISKTEVWDTQMKSHMNT